LIPIVIWKFPQREPTYSQALEQHIIKRQRVEIQIVREADNMMRRRFGWLHACAWTETMHCRNETAVNDACNVTHRSRVETMSCREIAKAVESQGGPRGCRAKAGSGKNFSLSGQFQIVLVNLYFSLQIFLWPLSTALEIAWLLSRQ